LLVVGEKNVQTVTRLLINIDHIATLRNARRESFPDPVNAASICETAGADGVVFHLREDRRHITDRDVRLLRQTVRTKLDFELSLAPEIVNICLETGPDLATFVPERREEVTTEGGLDVPANRDRLADVIPAMHEAGIEVALFVDAAEEQVHASHEAGADAIELHTGDYANAATDAERKRIAEMHANAARIAHRLGLLVHAGHGLDYLNFPFFRATVPHLHEVSIGFAIIARAVFVGLDRAVREMCDVVKR
jgi:pyridoxine 5-phosphate synthase